MWMRIEVEVEVEGGVQRGGMEYLCTIVRNRLKEFESGAGLCTILKAVGPIRIVETKFEK